ncbi:MAG: cadherin repeat domain-containing protein, partial [Thermoguttaceae bacterium]|nr:cadherin repeat domain-containing protein [Thermoguttaceae bacterium]
MKSLARFRSSSAWTFFANRPSALERAVRQSPKSRRLRMEPLENRALLTVDAFGGAASSIDSDVGATWGPDPEPAAFSASVLATDAAIVDVSAVDATLADASFNVQVETPEPLAPPSFEQLMETLGQVKIESLDDESDAASLSFLDEAASATQLLNSLNLQDISQGTPRQVVFYDSSDADFDESTLNLDDESVYYVDAANVSDAESYSATPRSGGGNSGGSSNSGGGNSGGSSNSGGGNSGGSSNSGGGNSGGSNNPGDTTVNDPSDCHLTTYGSPVIFECATFTGSGGSDQGPYFGFSTPSIPAGYIGYVSFEGGDAVYGEDYVVTMATLGENDVVTPNSDYVSGGKDSNDVYNVYVYGQVTYSVVPLNDFAFEALEEVVAKLYLVDVMSGGADYDPTPILCDSFTATIYQAPEFITEGDDIYAVNTDEYEVFKYGKPEVGAAVTEWGFNNKRNGRVVTYSLVEPSEYFEINSATGAISWKALPPEGDYDFEITVKVADAEYPALYDVADVDISIGWANFILCVDQPVPGQPNVTNASLEVGHAFWHIDITPSLEDVYYENISFANNSYGFYPDTNSESDNAGVLLYDTETEMDVYAVFVVETEENFISLLQLTY